MPDETLLRTQSRHDPGRWRVGDRRTDPNANGNEAVNYLVTRVVRDGNSEQVFGVVTEESVSGRSHDPAAD